jgi:hypothetical protein
MAPLVKHLLIASRFDNIVREIDEKLGQATLSSSVIAEDRRERGISKRFGKALAKGLAGTSVVTQTIHGSVVVLHAPRPNIPKEAPNNMFEQADGLLLYKLVDHVAENGADSVEALVRLADVCKTNVVQQDFLDDEDGDRLAELGASLHDAEA